MHHSFVSGWTFFNFFFSSFCWFSNWLTFWSSKQPCANRLHVQWLTLSLADKFGKLTKRRWKVLAFLPSFSSIWWVDLVNEHFLFPRCNFKILSHPSTSGISWKKSLCGRRSCLCQTQWSPFGLRCRELGLIWRVFSLDLKIFVTSCLRTPSDSTELTSTSRWAKRNDLRIVYWL